MGKIRIIADIEMVKFLIKEANHIHPKLDVTHIRSMGTESKYHEVILDSIYVADDMSNLYDIELEDHYYGGPLHRSFTTWKLTKQ